MISELYFSSCTRLCDVRTSKEELFAAIETGKSIPMPKDEKAISKKLRSIHGGLYPQSDLVVADDPLAEIAARTWIDEAKNLNREELLHRPYYKWLGQLEQTKSEVFEAVKKLNGPFYRTQLTCL
jgi:hypothetical protein